MTNLCGVTPSNWVATGCNPCLRKREECARMHKWYTTSQFYRRNRAEWILNVSCIWLLGLWDGLFVIVGLVGGVYL